MQFIDTDEGFIPLSRVTRIQPGSKDRQGVIWYDDASDIEAKTFGDVPRDFEIMYADSVPAAPGFHVVGFIDGTDEVVTAPVLAWQILDGTAYAVTPDATDTDAGILCPDGRVIEPYIATYDDIEAYRAERRKQLAREQAA